MKAHKTTPDINAQTTHVKEGDSASADRRNQKGSAFDGQINEHTIAEGQHSDDVHEGNIYDNAANAQTRTLPKSEQ